MVRSIEIPEPVFEADVSARWLHDSDKDQYTCKVLVGGVFPVFEKTYTVEPLSKSEDDVRLEFLAEFAERFKALLAS